MTDGGRNTPCLPASGFRPDPNGDIHNPLPLPRKRTLVQVQIMIRIGYASGIRLEEVSAFRRYLIGAEYNARQSRAPVQRG